MRQAVFIFLLVTFFAAAFFSTARSDDLAEAEFLRSTEFYRSGDYSSAISGFKSLLDGLKLTSIDRIIKTHSYLGSAYCSTGEIEMAKEHFNAVLNFNADYELQGSDFTPAAVDLFESLKKERRVAAQGANNPPLMKPPLSERSGEKGILRDSASQADGLAMAFKAEEQPNRENMKNSYFNNFIPFGFGQFKNGEIKKGYAFLLSESLFFAGAVSTFTSFKVLQRSDGSFEDPSVGKGLKSGFYISTAFFTALALTGIFDAMTNYSEFPYRKDGKTEPSISLSPMPEGGLALAVVF